MNKWKIRFWICLTILFLTFGLSFYVILDQGVSLTYIKEGYADTEADLNQLVKIINETDLSKSQIKKSLKKNHLDFNTDTVSLQRINLIFKESKLYRVELSW